MARIDLFTTIHKGLRAALFATAEAAARADFEQRAAADAVAAEVRHLLELLAEHAALEDAQIVSAVAQSCPQLAAELHGEHVRLAGRERELSRRVERLIASAPAARVAHGRKLVEELHRLVAEQLLHMEREELAANRQLWAHASDAELAQLHERIVAALPIERQLEWLALLLPAVNPTERAQLLASLRAATAAIPAATPAATAEVAPC